jgi:hypothetical protein
MGDTLNVIFKVYAMYNKNEFNDTIQATNYISGTLIRPISFESVQLFRPLDFAQFDLINNQSNQLDSITFEWSNPNPFSEKQLVMYTSNQTDSFIISLNNTQNSQTISKSQLYLQFLDNTALNDSVFIKWYVAESYKQAQNLSVKRTICLKKLESTGMNENLFLNKIKVYPNPVSSGKLFIQNTDFNSFTVEVYNQLGVLVYPETFCLNGNTILDLEGLSGLYFLKIKVEGKIYTKSILVNE